MEWFRHHLDDKIVHSNEEMIDEMHFFEGLTNPDVSSNMACYKSQSPAAGWVKKRKKLRKVNGQGPRRAIKAETEVVCVDDRSLVQEDRVDLQRVKAEAKALGEPTDLGLARPGLGHGYSRAKVKFNMNRVDNMLIQAIFLLDNLDKDVNSFSMRVRYDGEYLVEGFAYDLPALTLSSSCFDSSRVIWIFNIFWIWMPNMVKGISPGSSAAVDSDRCSMVLIYQIEDHFLSSLEICTMARNRFLFNLEASVRRVAVDSIWYIPLVSLTVSWSVQFSSVL
ncbi:uncharacterized protein A4U43_C08F30100 [Asparagus officinalis]|nr:uncharacterized protein A4U43_C08F30100 [Asparagus officinalis]